MKDNIIIALNKNDFQNLLYKELIIELEGAENKGKYKGNAHHLTQRLCDNIWKKLTEDK